MQTQILEKIKMIVGLKNSGAGMKQIRFYARSLKLRSNDITVTQQVILMCFTAVVSPDG